MRFHADLHIHSKHSRATSRDLDLEHLAHWAARKGIDVVATGDFTHPAWSAELKDKLVPAEPGLFRLRDDIEKAVAETLPAACRNPVRFMLEVEISTIYKKGEKTRKVHHLIYAPDFATVDRISTRLARIGNIASDGRPILGLDSRHLLEITLESSPDAYFIPAHVWTPWFAALGSQSGFDSIVECYGDLADNIFAVETGLSSDPAMNWRVSFLDRYRLVSNSDAHSPGKLGREATTFDCDIDYFAIRDALKTGHGYVGTVEFFPEEGKYHLDGHRKCNVRLTPRETLANDGRCPICGERVTIGVEHRVETLADRDEWNVTPPATAGAVSNLVPLPEVLSEIAASGPTSKTVERSYDKLIATLGPELFILQSAPIEDVKHVTSSLLAEALTRLRAGQVIREAGYDGEYGVIRLFEDSELKQMTGGGLLFDAPAAARKKGKAIGDGFGSALEAPSPAPRLRGEGRGEGDSPTLGLAESPPHPTSLGQSSAQAPSVRQEFRRPSDFSPQAGRGDSRQRRSDDPIRLGQGPEQLLAGLDDDQRHAAATTAGPLLIIAGPGSGKTRTLTHRIAHIVADHDVAPEQCLAITFTRRAADQMRERLIDLLGKHAERIAIHTFHSLGLMMLREQPDAAGLQRGFRIADEAERVALLAKTLDLSEHKAETLLRVISRAKRGGNPQDTNLVEAIAAYRRALRAANTVDFDDLIGLTVDLLKASPILAEHYRSRFRFISVDEFQDLDAQQYLLLTLLAPADANICVIGDPDQAIYGFRGADASCFERFRKDYPHAATVCLARNYRSSGTIVTASAQVLAAVRSDAGMAEIVRDMHECITIHAAATERAEAEFVVASIERLIGGHTFFSLDSGRSTGARADLSFSDFAVLYRTDAQSAALIEAFERSGIPFKKHGDVALGDDPSVQALLRAMGTLDETTGKTIIDTLRTAASQLEHKNQAAGAEIRSALQRLTRVAQTCEGNGKHLSDAIALANDVDLFDPRADRVSLLTLHAAKGLEFPVVFVTGLEDGLLPLHWGQADPASAAEERRLFYVGMTRAKDQLILTRALARPWRGRVCAQSPSPYLADIERELLTYQRNEVPRRRPENRQLSLF